MFVTKRDGTKERVQFDKVTSRIKSLCEGLDMEFVDPVSRAARSAAPRGVEHMVVCAMRPDPASPLAFCVFSVV